jgi:GDP-L-fucose synthase
VILSTGNEITIKDLVNLIADIYDYKGEIVWDTSKPEGQYRKPSDNSVIKELAPDFKFTPIKEGLMKSIEWFIENYHFARK